MKLNRDKFRTVLLISLQCKTLSCGGFLLKIYQLGLLYKYSESLVYSSEKCVRFVGWAAVHQMMHFNTPGEILLANKWALGASCMNGGEHCLSTCSHHSVMIQSRSELYVDAVPPFNPDYTNTHMKHITNRDTRNCFLRLCAHGCF